MERLWNYSFLDMFLQWEVGTIKISLRNNWKVLGDSCHAQIDIDFMVNVWSTCFADHGSFILFSIYSAQD